MTAPLDGAAPRSSRTRGISPRVYVLVVIVEALVVLGLVWLGFHFG